MPYLADERPQHVELVLRATDELASLHSQHHGLRTLVIITSHKLLKRGFDDPQGEPLALGQFPFPFEEKDAVEGQLDAGEAGDLRQELTFVLVVHCPGLFLTFLKIVRVSTDREATVEGEG